MNYKNIIARLPYTEPFLFVDELLHLDENGVEGIYAFKAGSGFYKGHFKNGPVTPGAILTECCAQIGLVSLGIHLLNKEEPLIEKSPKIALSSSCMEFYLPVFPDEKVRVVSKRIYFRFNKLKCEVKMYNNDRKLVCKGTISGMLINVGNG